MNKDMKMIGFYQDKNIMISEVVKRGAKQGLAEPQILEGLEKVFDRVQSGENIKPISLVWEVWEEAKKTQGEEYLQWCLSRDQYMAKIDSLNRSITTRDIIIYSILTLILSSAAFATWTYYYV
jgi:hypothetical protein